MSQQLRGKEILSRLIWYIHFLILMATPYVNKVSKLRIVERAKQLIFQADL